MKKRSEATSFILIDEEHNVWKCHACGHIETFEADCPMENGWDLCPHCARRIVLAVWSM